MMRLSSTTLQAPPPVLLLTLRIGGRTVRLTDGTGLEVPLRVTGAADLHFDPGLSTTATDRMLGWFSGDLSPRTVSCECMLGFDLALEIARGHSLYESSAELAQLYVGQSWEDRRVLIQGKVQEPLYGSKNEPFSFAITENPGEDSSLIPSSSWTLSPQTFPRSDYPSRAVAYSGTGVPAHDPNLTGAGYPLIIGAPGQTSATDVGDATYAGTCPATPALYVESDSDGTSTTTTDFAILVAGGVTNASDVGASVKIFNKTMGTTWTATVSASSDRLGQPFSYVTPPTTADIPVQGDELWCAWDPGEGGGVPYGSSMLRRADHVVRWALDQSSLRVDRGGFPRLGALASYQIDGYINTRTSPWSWLKTEILPLLPVSVVSGPDGIAVVPWDFNATSAKAVVHLEEGRNFDRLSPVSMSSWSDVINKVTIRFAPDASSGTPTMYRCFTGKLSASEEADPYTLPDHWALRSQPVFGVREEEVTTSYIYDSATAELVATWMLRARAFPRRTLGIQLPQSLDWLRPGDVISLTSADLHLSSQVAHVESLAPAPGGAILCSVTWWEPMSYPAR